MLWLLYLTLSWLIAGWTPLFAGVPFVSLFLCVSSIFLTSFVAAMSLLNNLGSIWAHCLGVKPMRPEAQGSSYKSLFHPVDSVFFMLEHVCSVWAAWSLAEIRGVGDLELATMWVLGIRPRSSRRAKVVIHCGDISPAPLRPLRSSSCSSPLSSMC